MRHRRRDRAAALCLASSARACRPRQSLAATRPRFPERDRWRFRRPDKVTDSLFNPPTAQARRGHRLASTPRTPWSRPWFLRHLHRPRLSASMTRPAHRESALVRSSDAIRMVEASVATATDVDQAVVPASATRWARFTADPIGPDTRQTVTRCSRNSASPASKPPTARRMVSLGQLGRKTGSGFFEYSR
jgi:3-hydroxybutyryl-CoA dehydrogenase